LNGNEFILRSLVCDGISHLFMVPGGLVDPMLPALQKVSELRPIVAAQEGGAAYMADGYARASGNYGACLCIGGPGLTNTATAVSAALTDESPVLVLSGEVATYMEGLGLFQDATAGTYNDTQVMHTLTAESSSIPDVRLLAHRLRGAVKQMLDGARAPVHLSLPRDVQTGEVDVDPVATAPKYLGSEALDVEAAGQLWSMLTTAGNAPRVAILVGGGAIADDTAADLLKVAERFHLPIMTTEHAKGTFPEDHELSLGVFGYAGCPQATQAVLKQPLDLLAVLGATLNVRDAMYWSDELRPKLGILTVNVSSVHVGCHFENETFVRGHAGAFLRWLTKVSDKTAEPLIAGIEERRKWIKELRAQPRYYDLENTTSDQTPIHPARMVAECRKVMPRDAIAIIDSGAHRAFGVHYWDTFGPRKFLTAAALGPMGWGVGAGIGAKAACPDAPVVVFTGDGCMRMHGMEVQTSARYGLPVIYVISNNRALGNVWLRVHGEGPIPNEITSTSDIDWAGFGRSLGAEGVKVTKPDEMVPAFEQALGANKTFVIDVRTDRAATTPVEPYHKAAAEWSYQE
jgi:acetolactate synthase-1/2/3 large subunit